MTTVSFPSRCAVAVICGEHIVSQVYPASVPIEVFIDNIVELINDDLKRRGSVALEPGSAHELHRVNGTRLEITKTLDELGIEDGTTLVLVPAQQGESFEPQYESLSTALARVGKRLFIPVTAETAVRTALAILATVVLSMTVLTVAVRLRTDTWTASLAVLTTGTLLAVGSLAAWRWRPDRCEVSMGLACSAIAPLAIGLAAAAPGPVGSAHLFIAALAIAVMTGALVAVTGRHLTIAAAIVAVCVLGGLVAAVRMWQPVTAQRLGMCALIALLVLITAGPTVALWTAKLRPPRFGSITGRDLFRRDDGMPADAVTPVDEDATEDTDEDSRLDHPAGLDRTPRGDVVAAAAGRANSVLTGICVAAAVCLPVAVWATLVPGQPHSTAAAVLSALFVLIFISRGRAFADRRQAIALVCGAATAVCSGVSRYVFPGVLHITENSVAPLIGGSLLLLAFAGAGLAAALLVPVTRFTPLARMAAEWVELAAIVAALPLAAWIAGLFTWVRMR